MKTSARDIAGIECLCNEGPNRDTAVVFFHGYGANMHDLFPLWELWQHDKFDWFFPNGTMSLPMGYYEGRAWFSIDVEALERAIRSGQHRDLAINVPPEFDITLKQQELFIRELATKYQKIIIGGFSQGAMCASHLAMKADLNLAGLVLLSGNLLADSKFPASAKALPFYQAHGSRDPILPLLGAKLLEEKLQGLNFQGKLHVFDGGHEIPMKVIQEVKSFLHQL
jgi:phospholipase/carboxylesterase